MSTQRLNTQRRKVKLTRKKLLFPALLSPPKVSFFLSSWFSPPFYCNWWMIFEIWKKEIPLSHFVLWLFYGLAFDSTSLYSLKEADSKTMLHSGTQDPSDTARRSLSQFWRSKIPRKMFLNYIKFGDLLILRFLNREKVRRATPLQASDAPSLQLHTTMGAALYQL